MAEVQAPEIIASGEFLSEQKAYLQGFFAAVAQNYPYVGQVGSGQFSADPNLGGPNLADAPTFFNTPVEDLCAEERWKYESNPLDLWDELLEHAAEDKVPNAELRYRFKFHGLFHVAPAQDSFMMRLRAPGGIVSTDQLRGLADIAEQFGCGRLDITTRAGIQIREFAPRSIVDVLNAVRALGMTSQGAGADNIRNITASPLAGIDAAELIDVRPYANALQSYILNSRDMFGLPRKFNIAFDGGGTISTLADTNDIGFLAVRIAEGKSVPSGVYFRVLLCGITGHRQFASDCGLLLRPDQLVAVAAAMVRVFAEHGDRTDRKKARLKYLIDKWGTGRFLEETERKLTFPIVRISAQESEARNAIDRTAHLGIHAQPQVGLHYIGVVVPVGWLPVGQARALADVADRYGSGEIRLTVWQNLLLPNITTQNLDAAREALRNAGLEVEGGRVLSGTVACTGSRGCRFAATDTKGHALELATSLDATFPVLQPINLHVTGCSHSCAQHYIGDIGLMGVKIGGEPGYQVSVGGGADNDQALARELFPGLPYKEVQSALHNIMKQYMEQAVQGESFLEFCGRHTIRELRGFCKVERFSEVGA
ncbi:NirA family protein [Terriglobus roseus]|uniref:NAD(P)H-dependent nitrite reductase catalytic subunit n=1 Tax=Terriglobus roseus TaxID=392734 RepID=A0A1G7JF57_9BACT|nr:NirA family protein [Terriglobus roseus]SDF23577.1 NAD(P)H-dependent nitrite reductase catalytic subunit [Terriglobus roseus]